MSPSPSPTPLSQHPSSNADDTHYLASLTQSQVRWWGGGGGSYPNGNVANYKDFDPFTHSPHYLLVCFGSMEKRVSPIILWWWSPVLHVHVCSYLVPWSIMVGTWVFTETDSHVHVEHPFSGIEYWCVQIGKVFLFGRAQLQDFRQLWSYCVCIGKIRVMVFETFSSSQWIGCIVPWKCVFYIVLVSPEVESFVDNACTPTWGNTALQLYVNL